MGESSLFNSDKHKISVSARMGTSERKIESKNESRCEQHHSLMSRTTPFIMVS